MEPSLRLTPSTSTKVASTADSANSLGLHDTLRLGPRSLAVDTAGKNTLHSRLDNWHETQDNLKLTMLRNAYGMHAPVRLLMERKIVSRNPHMPALPQSNIHLDILMGRDESIDTADFMGAAGIQGGPTMDIHADMERKIRM